MLFTWNQDMRDTAFFFLCDPTYVVHMHMFFSLNKHNMIDINTLNTGIIKLFVFYSNYHRSIKRICKELKSIISRQYCKIYNNDATISFLYHLLCRISKWKLIIR